MISETLDVLIRLAVAGGLGALLGIERQLHGRWAGARTHMMVALGCSVFVLVGISLTRDTTVQDDLTELLVGANPLSRVIQGVAAGIGFLGAGTILKLSDRMEIKGLTTASSIWLAAAVGCAAGLALYPLAVAATLISLVVLAALRPLEKRFDR